MGPVRPDVKNAEILRSEAMLNNLIEELHTANVRHQVRMDMEKKLEGCKEQFKSVLSGKTSLNDFEKKLHEIDQMLAIESIQQAENEIPKQEHTRAAFLALENIRKELEAGKMQPTKARHEVKEIMRPHTAP